MSCNNYFEHHLTIIKALYKLCLQLPPFSNEEVNDVDSDFLKLLKDTSESTNFNDNFQEQGQSIVTRIIAQYPHITPELNRDLLWFFGGECLHFMADEELEQYQQLDELINSDESKSISYADAKATIFQLH